MLQQLVTKFLLKVWTQDNKYCVCILAEEPPRISECYLTFLKTRIMGLHFAADSMRYLRWNFYGGLRNTSYFISARMSDVSAVQGHPRSIIDLGTSWKRVCDFLLVRYNNLGPILHRFGDIAGFMCSWPHAYSTLILGCFRCTRSPMSESLWAGALCCSAVKLFLKYSDLSPERHGETDRLTDRPTDRQTTYYRITALSIASPVKILEYHMIELEHLRKLDERIAYEDQ